MASQSLEIENKHDPSIYTHNYTLMFVCNLKQLGELPICIMTIVAIQCVNIT